MACNGCKQALAGPTPFVADLGSYQQDVGAYQDLAGVEEVLPMAGAAAGAYHGYKRNKSIGWAIGWSVFGSFFPLLAGGLAIAQGFGKPKGK